MTKFDETSKWKGPRNLPKPSPKKAKRVRARKSRKANRGTYRGQ